MLITYLGPSDSIDIDHKTCKRGESINVLAAVGGKVPDERLAEAHAELAAAIAAIDHEGAAALREEIVGLNAGSGLLAQTGTWAPASEKSTE